MCDVCVRVFWCACACACECVSSKSLFYEFQKFSSKLIPLISRSVSLEILEFWKNSDSSIGRSKHVHVGVYGVYTHTHTHTHTQTQTHIIGLRVLACGSGLFARVPALPCGNVNFSDFTYRPPVRAGTKPRAPFIPRISSTGPWVSLGRRVRAGTIGTGPHGYRSHRGRYRLHPIPPSPVSPSPNTAFTRIHSGKGACVTPSGLNGAHGSVPVRTGGYTRLYPHTVATLDGFFALNFLENLR